MTPEEAARIAQDAIDLFIEYRDQHGYDEGRARIAAVTEVQYGVSVDVEQIMMEVAR